MYADSLEFSIIKGKTLLSISAEKGDEKIRFKFSDGSEYWLLHDQDCCENVSVEDVCGDVNDLIGSPLLMAEMVTSQEPLPDKPWEKIIDGHTPESFTWTFYKLGTIKGYVTIRWLGESNGYYSESVDFVEVIKLA